MSIEYLLIMVFVLLLAVPSFAVFKSYVEGSSDEVLKTSVSSIGQEIVSYASKMYYYGSPSKTTLRFNMPSGVEAMYLLKKGDEHVLVFDIMTENGVIQIFKDCPVPLQVAGSAESCGDAICTQFPPELVSEGRKNLLIEAAMCPLPCVQLKIS